jgi:hypothetical protein
MTDYDPDSADGRAQRMGIPPYDKPTDPAAAQEPRTADPWCRMDYEHEHHYHGPHFIEVMVPEAAQPIPAEPSPDHEPDPPPYAEVERLYRPEPAASLDVEEVKRRHAVHWETCTDQDHAADLHRILAAQPTADHAE